MDSWNRQARCTQNSIGLIQQNTRRKPRAFIIHIYDIDGIEQYITEFKAEREDKVAKGSRTYGYVKKNRLDSVENELLTVISNQINIWTNEKISVFVLGNLKFVANISIWVVKDDIRLGLKLRYLGTLLITSYIHTTLHNTKRTREERRLTIRANRWSIENPEYSSRHILV